jgi:hypothetical protein
MQMRRWKGTASVTSVITPFRVASIPGAETCQRQGRVNRGSLDHGGAHRYQVVYLSLLFLLIGTV